MNKDLTQSEFWEQSMQSLSMKVDEFEALLNEVG
jgi:oligoendopeptidase F